MSEDVTQLLLRTELGHVLHHSYLVEVFSLLHLSDLLPGVVLLVVEQNVLQRVLVIVVSSWIYIYN